MQNPRIKTAQIIQLIIEDKIFFADIKNNIGEKDLPFVNMLALTSLRKWNSLNKILNNLLTKKIPNKHRFAKYLILLAISEILFLNTPDYAVINETVKNVKYSCGKILSGLANALLRKVVNQKEIFLDKIKNYSNIPDTFIPILDGYSEDIINKISKMISVIPPLDITVKDNQSLWTEKLNATILPNGSLRIFDNVQVSKLEGFNDGKWWVQDAASSLPAMLFENIENKKVIDLCAAPGGKTAQILLKGANVTALDISEKRLITLQENMKRLGFDKIKTIAIDALDFMNNSNEKFDAVLLDAPCSATGTFRRHPEVLHIKNTEDVKKSAELQKKLLRTCKNILNVGGTLIYSVCSISKQEGENQIENFLKEEKCFEIVPIKEADISTFGQWEDNFILSNGMLRTLPCYENEKKGIDSFFICKMKRII